MDLGPPEVGEAVQVKWPDGLFYGAKYLGSNVSHMYQVHANALTARQGHAHMYSFAGVITFWGGC